MIDSPTTVASHPDYELDCEMSLEDEFQALADRVEAAGWTGAQAAVVMLSLARNHIESRKAVASDERRISDARMKAAH